MSKRPRQTSRLSFPVTLFRMLEDAETDGFCDVVSWQPHGRSFLIHNRDKFVDRVLPEYFPSQRQFASFLRQLNIYGFLRMTRMGPDNGAYWHRHFIRGHHHFLYRIERIAVNGNEVRKPSISPRDQPDFYTMPSAEAMLRIEKESISSPHTVPTATSLDPGLRIPLESSLQSDDILRPHTLLQQHNQRVCELSSLTPSAQVTNQIGSETLLRLLPIIQCLGQQDSTVNLAPYLGMINTPATAAIPPHSSTTPLSLERNRSSPVLHPARLINQAQVAAGSSEMLQTSISNTILEQLRRLLDRQQQEEQSFQRMSEHHSNNASPSHTNLVPNPQAFLPFEMSYINQLLRQGNTASRQAPARTNQLSSFQDLESTLSVMSTLSFLSSGFGSAQRTATSSNSVRSYGDDSEKSNRDWKSARSYHSNNR